MLLQYPPENRIYKNADAAVLYELGKTDNQIALWKKSMSEDEWDKLKVIVVSPHMPRNQNRQMIYFQSLLGEKEEGNRIIYMDGEPNQEEKALNLLGVHELDRDIAIAFFRDPCVCIVTYLEMQAKSLSKCISLKWWHQSRLIVRFHLFTAFLNWSGSSGLCK